MLLLSHVWDPKMLFKSILVTPLNILSIQCFDGAQV